MVSSNVNLPDDVLDQEKTDFALAIEELRTTRLTQQRVCEWYQSADPLLNSADPSMFLAREQVRAAERVLTRVTNYYTTLRANAAAAAATAAAASESNLATIEDSSDDEYPIADDDPFFVEGSLRYLDRADPTGVSQYRRDRDVACTMTPAALECAEPRLDDPTPPYTSLPGTPNVRSSAAGGIQSDGHTSAAPGSTSLTSSTGFLTGAAGPTTPAAPVTPSKPSTSSSLYRSTDVDGPLRSPFPLNKHYAVTKGRRTGVYASWNEARTFVKGLPGAVYQGFSTFDAAMTAYLRVRTLGEVEVIRGPQDTEAAFGPVETAEDI